MSASLVTLKRAVLNPLNRHTERNPLEKTGFYTHSQTTVSSKNEPDCAATSRHLRQTHSFHHDIISGAPRADFSVLLWRLLLLLPQKVCKCFSCSRASGPVPQSADSSALQRQHLAKHSCGGRLDISDVWFSCTTMQELNRSCFHDGILQIVELRCWGCRDGTSPPTKSRSVYLMIFSHCSFTRCRWFIHPPPSLRCEMTVLENRPNIEAGHLCDQRQVFKNMEGLAHTVEKIRHVQYKQLCSLSEDVQSWQPQRKNNMAAHNNGKKSDVTSANPVYSPDRSLLFKTCTTLIPKTMF